MRFEFMQYQAGERLCIKPLMPGRGGRNYGLGYFNHCTSPPTISNVKLKDRYYNRTDIQFHFYDIKLCHTMTYGHYEEFLDNFIKRGKKHNCVVHISNSMIPKLDGTNDLVSLYDIDYFYEVLDKIMSMKEDLIVEISNKQTTESNDIGKHKILELSKKLFKCDKVKHYVIIEEIYKKQINPEMVGSNDPWDIQFIDDYVVPYQELRRHDMKPEMYFINGIIQEDFNGIDMINMKQQRDN
jgi:hypothetical protein